MRSKSRLIFSSRSAFNSERFGKIVNNLSLEILLNIRKVNLEIILN